MPKMKTKRALAKRVKVTGKGKLKRHSAYTSHLAPRKTHKQNTKNFICWILCTQNTFFLVQKTERKKKKSFVFSQI